MLKTLIVEDNATFRRSLNELLCTRFPSITIEEAVDGEEAIQKIDASVPDLIFMDIKLPGESGLHVTKRVKSKYPKMIIIVLTYYDSPEHREAAFRCGANHFLAKGTSIEEIVELVQSIESKKDPDSHDPNRG